MRERVERTMSQERYFVQRILLWFVEYGDALRIAKEATCG